MSMRSRLPAGLYVTIVASGVLHAGVVAAVVARARSHRNLPAETVLTTKLVRLGKERPKEFLPRKEEPPPPAPKPLTQVAPPATSEPGQKSLGDKLSEMHKLSDALDRLKKKKDEPVEGRADGAADGEASRLSEALLGNKYVTEVYKCVKANYAVEGIPPERIAGKSARIFIRVKPDGAFFDVRLEQGSGLGPFDRAVERAVLRCGRVTPPQELADRVHEDGIEFEFTP